MPRAPVLTDRVAAQIEHKIEQDGYAVGAWLPPAIELGTLFGVHRTTVRSALKKLHKRGIVEYRENVGAQVKARRLTIITQLTRSTVENDEEWRGFPGAAARAGYESYCDITRSGEVPAPGDVAELLRIPPETPVFVRARNQGVFRGGERDPFQLATSWYTLATLADVPEIRDVLDVDPPPVRRKMLDAGRGIHYEHTVGVRNGSVEECAVLGLLPASPVLEVWRLCVETSTGTRLEVTRIVANPAKVKIRY